MRRSSQLGFTLIEVMIGLAILAAALVVLLRGSSMNVAATQQARMMTAATELARSKMYDIEAELFEEGFSQLEESEDGEFDDEGWPMIKWEYEISKIELPNLGALEGFMGGDEEPGAEGAEGQSGGMLGGLMGMAGGLGGSDGGAGSGLISSQFEIFRNILEESIRKVHLTISYRVAGSDEKFSVDCYFTDPAAVKRVINLGPADEREDKDKDKEKDS